MMHAMEAIFRHLALDEISFYERKKLIRLRTEDIELLRALHIPLQLYETELINAFYDHLMSFDFAQDLLADPEIRARLQSTQKTYFRKLTAGVYDLDYAKDRIRVGIAHERVGLTTQWYIGSYAVYLELTSHYIAKILSQTPTLIEPSINALYKVALLDITLAFDAYMYASHESIQAARQEVSDKYDDQLKLQQTIDRIQKAFILNASYDSALELLLNELIEFTNSAFGLIGDVLHDENDAPYLKLRALTNIAWNDETRVLYESNQENGLEFHNHHNLLGSVMTTGKPVIANSPNTDNRSGGVPEGHPTLNSYLGLPFYHNGNIVGMIGLANAEGGYNEHTVERLAPILETLESLYEARKLRDQLTVTLLENDELRQQNETQIAILLQKSADAIGIINKDMVITECNDAAVKLYGASSRQDLIGLSPLKISAENQPDGSSKKLAKHYISKALTEGYQRFEWLQNTTHGENTPTEVTLTPVIFHGEACIQVVWRDLTEIKAKENRIKQLAYFDELTGLANKNLFTDRVKHLLELSKRFNYTIAVVYLDLVNHEDVKETLGYIAGDALLHAVGRRIASTIRSADTLARYVFNDDPKHCDIDPRAIDREFDSLARINGEVFALAAVVKSADAAAMMVSRLQDTLKAPFAIADSKVMVNTRTGIALYPQDAETFETLTRGAAIALDIAKEKLQPSYFFNVRLGEEIQRRSLIAKRIEYSLKFDPDSFSIRIQPQVNAQTHQLTGAEILLRWEDSSLGSIPPGVFIPIAEERGLINEITKLVIKFTCHALESWKKLGYAKLSNLGVRMAINISAKSIDNLVFIDEFIADIKECGLTPEDFELELTETGIMRDPDTAIEIIKKLKQENFVLAIDDFGMGHSSLSYLRNIEADILKIDMFYIRNMLNDSKNMAIVKTIISTAQIFGMKTLAEGVEDIETANALKVLGCDYAQGYFYSYPLTISEFEEKWIKQNHHFQSGLNT
jgi:PAS domain S-box-containing protein